LERIVKVHSNPGDIVLDFFAGSGTTGDAAARHGRDYLLVDSNPQAVEMMRKRLSHVEIRDGEDEIDSEIPVDQQASLF
jgi:site-specific DNA-methyltransferase (adenine-specific)